MVVSVLWIICFVIGLSLYHKCILPKPITDVEHTQLSVSTLFKEFLDTFVSFFRKKEVFVAIAFMLLFRLPEALLNTVGPLFLRATSEKGGLALSLEAFGVVNGVVGVVGLLLGGILGGLVASKGGLKKWLWPMTFAITLPNIAYVYLGYAMPSTLFAVGVAIFVENFGYGLALVLICFLCYI